MESQPSKINSKQDIEKAELHIKIFLYNGSKDNLNYGGHKGLSSKCNMTRCSAYTESVFIG